MSVPSVPPPKVQHAWVNGLDLAYVEQGHGVAVVFVHGAPGDHRCWEGQREVVADKYRDHERTLTADTREGPWKS